MKSLIPGFAVALALSLTATAPVSADPSPASSVAKARQEIAVLKSHSPPADKALACKKLAIYGTPEAVPALAALLPDPELSSWARIALEAIPGKASDEALRGALKKTQGPLLVGVINSIGVRRDAKAVRPLSAQLNAADPKVVEAAAVALGRIGGNTASKALLRGLSKAPPTTRPGIALGCIRCAEKCLDEKKYAAATKIYDAVRKVAVSKQRQLEAMRGATLARQAKGLPLLLEALRSPDRATFGMGLQTARELRGRTITDALATELNRVPVNRQGPLLLAIADRQDDAVLPTILSAARTAAPDLQLTAIAIMIRRTDASCLPVLFELLSATDAEVAKAAQSALANWADDGVNTLLGTRLTQASGITRRRLVEIAGSRHLAATLPSLTRAANDEDPQIRSAGIKALGEAVTVADLGILTDLLANAKSADERAAIQAALESACVRITDKPAATGKLTRAFESSPAAAKCSLLRVFGLVGDATALESVRQAMTDSEPSVRDAAVRVLADWPEPLALAPLFEVFTTTTDESHRFLALRGCVRLLEADAQSADQKLKTFEELLTRTQRADDHKAILSGLGNVQTPAALTLVAPLLANPEVRVEAELAYINIAAATAKSAPAEARAAAERMQAESQNEIVRDRAAKVLSAAK